MSALSLTDLDVAGDRFEMRFSGSGGQGLVLAAMLMAEAVGANPQKRVVQTKSYGPEARGGASKSDVVISDDEIYYPKALSLDLLLAMTQEALDKYYPDLKDGGILVVDDMLVSRVPAGRHYGLPFTQIARERLGNVMVANVVSLGTIAAITGLTPLDTLLDVVLSRAPKGTGEVNKKALETGYQEGLALKARLGGVPVVM
ncbi:MAG: 2-oxoacid:acceptor oxidoreductase family protein [Candidatus Hydrogenedentes bacterium]|nr:2-oxoacid:acceptor oxidoreductase family protein [Candidatus Hydrogenedentota bacterium]